MLPSAATMLVSLRFTLRRIVDPHNMIGSFPKTSIGFGLRLGLTNPFHRPACAVILTNLAAFQNPFHRRVAREISFVAVRAFPWLRLISLISG
jgi:hypothetical protein